GGVGAGSRAAWAWAGVGLAPEAGSGTERGSPDFWGSSLIGEPVLPAAGAALPPSRGIPAFSAAITASPFLTFWKPALVNASASFFAAWGCAQRKVRKNLPPGFRT